jgi:hypothetical protein
VVPITKSWRELGFDIDELPEGTRISRPGYPIEGPRGGRDWGKSSPGEGSVQGYVPASTRYADWIGNKYGDMNIHDAYKPYVRN